MWKVVLVAVGLMGVIVGGYVFGGDGQEERERKHDRDVEEHNRQLRVNPPDLQCHQLGPGTSVETAMQQAVNETSVDAFVYLLDRTHEDVLVVDTSTGHQTCDRKLLRELEASAAVMNLVRKCGIKTIQCRDSDSAIGW